VPITLTINGETAADILQEISILASGLIKTKVEWKLMNSPADNEVRFATSVNDGFGTRTTGEIPAASDFGFTPAPDIVEDKPKRKRRTKEEMEAERAEGLPPQEGDPDLEPVAEVVDDILDDDTPSSPTTATRDDVKTYMSKIIQQRLLTPAEIKAIFIERAGGATNAAAMDEKFAADVLAGLTEAAEKKSA
jgi:hypothetical protein